MAQTKMTNRPTSGFFVPIFSKKLGARRGPFGEMAEGIGDLCEEK